MSTASRKDDHLRLCLEGDVEFTRTTTGFEKRRFFHSALPETALDRLDISVRLFGRTLAAPLIIEGMTGGTEEGGRINRDLARAARECGIGFGLGSQRAMLEDPNLASTYRVEGAQDMLVLGNLGLFQARDLDGPALDRLAGDVGALAMCLHLNAAQELMQPEGDRDFLNGAAILKRLVAETTVPIVVKETGCGFSRETGLVFLGAKVSHIDVAGAGGTSWTRVERMRSGRPAGPFDEWGIPTAVSLDEMQGLGFETVIASGGIRSGLDLAKALALGADACGIALPALRAHARGGVDEVRALIDRLVSELKTAMVLTGASTLGDLRNSRWE